MRARVFAMLWAVVLLALAPAMAVAADPPSAPPTITGLCATDKEYFWTVSSDATGLADYNIDFTTANSSDWSFPHGSQDVLSSSASGGHVTTLKTSKADGTSLFVRWSSFPDQLASSSTAPTTACAMASLTVKRVVQGGKATPDKFPVAIIRYVTSFSDPASSEQLTTAVTSNAALSVQPGFYAIGPTKDAGGYAALPTGYLFRSTSCVGGLGVTGATTDPRYERLVVPLDLGSSTVCTVTYHYGPVLSASIAAGKVSGTSGFKTTTITVRKGTYVTYLAKTSPSLAGRWLQVWTRTKTSAWRLTVTLKVRADGSIRYFVKVSVWTGFLAKWAGDKTYVASVASGRYVNVR